MIEGLITTWEWGVALALMYYRLVILVVRMWSLCLSLLIGLVAAVILMRGPVL